jgi:hypothetical protein
LARYYSNSNKIKEGDERMDSYLTDFIQLNRRLQSMYNNYNHEAPDPRLIDEIRNYNIIKRALNLYNSMLTNVEFNLETDNELLNELWEYSIKSIPISGLIDEFLEILIYGKHFFEIIYSENNEYFYI